MEAAATSTPSASPRTHSPGGWLRARNSSARHLGPPGAVAFQRGDREGAARASQRIRGERKAALGGERQRLGIARNLADHEGEVAAAQPFLQREQRILGSVGGDVDQPMPQRARQAGAIGPPGAPECFAILHPQPHALVRRIGQRIGRGGAHTVKRKGKRHGRAAALTRGSEDLAMPDLVRNKAGTPCLHAREGGGTARTDGKGIDSVEHCVPLMFSLPAIRNRLREEESPTLTGRQSLTSIPPGSGGTGCGGVSGSSSCTSMIPRPTWL
jgi:hypothetical protein